MTEGFSDLHRRGSPHAGGRALPSAARIVIAGDFRVGKTSMVTALSQTPPLHVEEFLTGDGVAIGAMPQSDRGDIRAVGIDIGRITVGANEVYLLGLPGRYNHWVAWDGIVGGALGAVVLADPHRLEWSYFSVDYFERWRIPFIVAVNTFDGAYRYPLQEVKDALKANVPVVDCDPRDTHSCHRALTTLVKHAMDVQGVTA